MENVTTLYFILNLKILDKYINMFCMHKYKKVHQKLKKVI